MTHRIVLRCKSSHALIKALRCLSRQKRGKFHAALLCEMEACEQRRRQENLCQQSNEKSSPTQCQVNWLSRSACHFTQSFDNKLESF